MLINNILKDKWIPVLNKNGSTVLTDVDGITNPNFITVNFPNEALNGGITQLLISLFQTYNCPKDEKEWINGLETPPKLKADPRHFKFDTFMQSNITKNEKTIQYLFLNSPAKDAVGKSKLYFDKNEVIQKICKGCAIAALSFFQSNANMSGKGCLVSLRGAAPMNSLIVGKTLWETIWYNVVPKDQLPKEWPFKGPLLPWTEKETNFSSLNSHILHSLWAMPRKIHLNVSDEEANCDICNAHGPVIKSFMELTPGIRYTPQKDTEVKWDPWFINYSPLEYKGKKRGFEAKKCWMPLTIEGLTELLTAEHPYTNSLYNFIENRTNIPAKLWIFGYISEQGKAIRGWLNQTENIPTNLPVAKNLIEQAQAWYKKSYYRLKISGVNKKYFFNQIKDQFYKIMDGVEPADKWEEYVKSYIEQQVQKIIPGWTFENQHPVRKKREVNKIPVRFTQEERSVILSWHSKLMRKPAALRQMKQTRSIDDVVNLPETVTLTNRLNGTMSTINIMDTETVAKIAKVLAHVNHSNSNWNIDDLAKGRREKLRSGTWDDIRGMVEGTSVNVINLAEIIRNWDVFKQTIK